MFRGSDKGFIDLLSNKWGIWISELNDQCNCDYLRLDKGEYLSDVI